MYKFPDDLYADVRIEDTIDTIIEFKKEELHERKVRNKQGAFVRIFDGDRWYYGSTTDLNDVQGVIDSLAEMAKPNPNIGEHPIVKAFQVNKDRLFMFQEDSIEDVAVEEKQGLLEGYLDILNCPEIVHYTALYRDNKTIKTFYSSKGADISYDKQSCSIRFHLELSYEDKRDSNMISKSAINFDELKGIDDHIEEEVGKCITFLKVAEPVVPGTYTVVLSPVATGVFTHESFGHKSESDFMVGDEAMRKEWALGKSIGGDGLNIVDDGLYPGSGYTPYDDEGTKGEKTYLVKKGKLAGRLHSIATAKALDESPTGNARAMNFEWEPIVRMTTTYIEKGSRSLEDIVGEIDNGLYVENVRHGSGMSTFTMAPTGSIKLKMVR